MFKVGNPVIGSNFFDRSKMKKEVTSLLALEQNFTGKAPRRSGKTSFLKEVMREIQRDYLYLDIRKTPRLEILTKQIMNYTYEKAGVKGFMQGILDNAVSFLKNAKHNLKINYAILEYSVEFFMNKEATPWKLFMEDLRTIDKVDQDLDTTIFIIFDEFQDIERLNTKDIDMLELMRGELQHQKKSVYMFLGSIEHLMTKIFENKKSPFYNFCRRLKLEPFDIDELLIQIEAAFKKKEIVIENSEELREVLNNLEGHPANTMLVMQKLYIDAVMNDTVCIRKEELDNAYWSAYEESQDLLNEYIVELNKKKHQHDVLYRLVNNEEQTLIPQALHQVYKGLLDTGYVTSRGRGEYKIVDGFLKEYLKAKEIRD